MPSSLNVCLMNDSFPPQIDGVANAVTNYASIIHQSHGRASVVTPYYPETQDDRFPFPVIRYPSLDTTAKVGYRAGFPFSAETLSRVEHLSPAIIHSHCPVASTILARTVRSALSVPVVFTYHTKFDIDIQNAVRSRFLQESAVRLLVENVEACDEVWVVSRGAGENLRSLGYQGEYLVMPNGVDFPRGRIAEAKVAEATASAQLPAGVPVFLFVGRMMWYKGLRLLLDALRMLSEDGTEFRMVFIGGGGDFDEVKDYAAGLGLERRCLFLGPILERDVIRAWYCRADLFLFPSTFDTNGLVVREAAACALGSVLVAGSCAAEGITDGQNGFLIEENAASMAALLRRLCAAPRAMKTVGERAQQEIYLSWEDAVANACRRYEIVLDHYAQGLYPPHREVPDELLNATADILEGFNRARSRGRALQQELTHQRERMAAQRSGAKIRLQEHMEELWQRLDRFL